jgi:hypothetical protein
MSKTADRATSKNLSSLRALWPFLVPYRGLMLAALIALVLTASISLVFPLAVRRVIDTFNVEQVGLLDQYFGAAIAIAALLALGTAVRYSLVTRLGERVVTDIRKAVFGRVIGMGPSFYETILTGEVLSRITTDTTLILSVIGSSVSIALRNLLIFVGGLGMMLLTSAKLTGLVLLIVPAVIIPILTLGRRLRKLSKENQDWIANSSGNASEYLGAVQTVQAFTHETLTRKSFDDVSEKSFVVARRRITARAWMTAIVIFLVFTGVVGVLWIGANDVSFSFEMETSAALGFGFRCGFLGLLHLEVIRDRIEREYDIELITTAPSVIYHVYMKDGEMIELHNPADMPDLSKVDHLEEPRIKATIMVPDDYLGDVLKLCQDRRGLQEDLTYAGSRAMAVYDLPLNEVVFDFYDRLKSVTKGYASFDYQMTGYRQDNLVKMAILVNEEPVDALSVMVHRDRAEQRGRAMCEKLKELIPRHMFKIPIQAAIGGKVIARETLAALRKDVTAKCYGGDASRKRKLLDKQKAGKKKMRQFGKVDIPQDAFISALKMDN